MSSPPNYIKMNGCLYRRANEGVLERIDKAQQAYNTLIEFWVQDHNLKNVVAKNFANLDVTALAHWLRDNFGVYIGDFAEAQMPLSAWKKYAEALKNEKEE